MFKSLIPLSLAAAILAVGCTPTKVEPASNEPSKADAVAGPTTTASNELAKCPECGAEVPADQLVSHDGQMLCQSCVDAHGH